MHILVLEDDLAQQQVLKIHGETLGHEVTCVADLNSFRHQCDSKPSFDFIIMDNMLADGVDAFNEIAWVRDTVGPEVGIVGLTGADSFRAMRTKYKDLGFLNHLYCKPLSLDNLESALFFISDERN
jgi:DNA-binding response OmpR family regulator